jgi:hypothetical protein
MTLFREVKYYRNMVLNGDRERIKDVVVAYFKLLKNFICLFIFGQFNGIISS